jgi:hypothetical protein
MNEIGQFIEFIGVLLLRRSPPPRNYLSDDMYQVIDKFPEGKAYPGATDLGCIFRL